MQILFVPKNKYLAVNQLCKQLDIPIRWDCIKGTTCFYGTVLRPLKSIEEHILITEHSCYFRTEDELMKPRYNALKLVLLLALLSPGMAYGTEPSPPPSQNELFEAYKARRKQRYEDALTKRAVLTKQKKIYIYAKQHKLGACEAQKLYRQHSVPPLK